MKRKIPVISIVLYVITGLLALYTIWTLKFSYTYITGLISSGQLIFRSHEYDVVSFFMTNSAHYAIFSVILFTLGWMFQKNHPFTQPQKAVPIVVSESSTIVETEAELPQKSEETE